MAFNSTDYVVFLVAVFAFFWPVVRWPRVRIPYLLVASYLFYFLWNGTMVGLILLSSLLDYYCGGAIAKHRANRRLSLALLWLSVGINLGLLAYFKYTNFFIENGVAALNAMGIDASMARLDIILPVGISFYTFQSLSYTIDIYRGELKPTRSLTNFLFFVSFFPQLIAGPIVRAVEFLPQMDREPQLHHHEVSDAFFRILRGLVKKMLIADYLAATIVDPYFVAPQNGNGLETFIALAGFHYQVYCDFSGYTDIAIGTAQLFGFRLPENFNRPYAAHTPANYWSRWHLTLSRFCFDYIYRPMGGNRGGTFKTHFNTVFTFSVIGFWHGPSWTFVLFGVYHSFGVIMTRVVTGWVARFEGRPRKEVEDELEGRPLAILATNVFVIGSLALFRSPDLDGALLVYSRLLVWDDVSLVYGGGGLAMLLVAIVVHYVPTKLTLGFVRNVERWPVLAQAVLVFVIGFAVLRMADFARQSFVYFQF